VLKLKVGLVEIFLLYYCYLCSVDIIMNVWLELSSRFFVTIVNNFALFFTWRISSSMLCY
jgi:hypothetical protein